MPTSMQRCESSWDRFYIFRYSIYYCRRENHLLASDFRINLGSFYIWAKLFDDPLRSWDTNSVSLIYFAKGTSFVATAFVNSWSLVVCQMGSFQSVHQDLSCLFTYLLSTTGFPLIVQTTDIETIKLLLYSLL